MFAIDHAATALLVKRRFPSAPMMPLLLSVQAMELAWVILNYLGIERTTTESTVRSVADIHLAYMPYSHSVGTALVAALAAWLIIEKGFRRAVLGRAVGLGIFSHLILDLLTHGHDIMLWPGLPSPKLGLGCMRPLHSLPSSLSSLTESSAGASIRVVEVCSHSLSSAIWLTSLSCHRRFRAPRPTSPAIHCSW